MSRSLGFAGLVAIAGVVLAMPASAQTSQDECPPGAKVKTEGDFKWCEPTVCDSDAQCSAGEVCKPVALCVQIGKVEAKPGQDGGSRLITTQRCGENQTCPNTTVCTEKSRCISRAQADRMGGITVKATPSASPMGAGAGADGAKKSCGCHVPGGGAGHAAGLGAALAGLGLGRGRRRR